jgi:hypothetical protein
MFGSGLLPLTEPLPRLCDLLGESEFLRRIGEQGLLAEQEVQPVLPAIELGRIDRLG